MRLRGQLSVARERLALCAAQSCPKVISQDCASLLAELDKTLPSVVFEVSAQDGAKLEDARVLSNGGLVQQRLDGRAITFDPGSYRLRVEAAGYAPEERQITVFASEKERVVRFALRPLQGSEEPRSADARESEAAPRVQDERNRAVPIATYVLGGSALGVLGAGVAMGVVGKDERDRLEKRCTDDNPCERSDTKKGRSLYVAADVAFGVAGALAIAATWVYVAKLIDDRDRRSSFANQVSAWADTHGASVVYQRAF